MIRTEASRLELKHRRSEQKRRRRLNRCDQKQAEASPVFEASRSHSETSPASEVKRRNLWQRCDDSVAIGDLWQRCDDGVLGFGKGWVGFLLG